jgi:hypothetical protein
MRSSTRAAKCRLSRADLEAVLDAVWLQTPPHMPFSTSVSMADP